MTPINMVKYPTFTIIYLLITSCLLSISNVSPQQLDEEFQTLDPSEQQQQGTDQPDDGRFPDIFSMMLERKSIRYLYEVNTNYGMPENEVKSILVEEMYSFEHKMGRLKFYDGKVDRNFYWYDKTGERISTRPYSCSKENISDKTYLGTDIFNSWFKDFEKLFAFSRTQGPTTDSFYGITGLMANTFVNHLKDLKSLNGLVLFSMKNIKMNARCWTLELPIDDNEHHQLRFLFEPLNKPVDKPNENAQVSPLVKFTAQSKYIDPTKANSFDKIVITILRRNFDNVKLSDLKLPEGFGCSRDDTLIDSDTSDKQSRAKPNSFPSYHARLVYNMEAILSVSKDRLGKRNSNGMSPVSVRNNDNDLPDIDDLSGSDRYYTTMPFSLIDDTGSFSIIYDSSAYNDNQARLVSWNLNSRIKSDIDLNKQVCRQVKILNDDNSSPVLEFPDDTRLILGSDGRRIMAFYDQDSQHSHLLNDASKDDSIDDNDSEDKFGFGTAGSDWTVVAYERRLGKFDMFDSTGQPFNQYATSMVRKFLYHRKTKQSIPISFDIYLYRDLGRLELQAHLHVNIRSIDRLEHWNRPNNLVDLSSCYMGKPRRSALVTIEYPLSDRYPSLKYVDKPHKEMRKSLASYFQYYFNLEDTRISSMELDIERDYLLAHIRLLDKPNIWTYAKNMPPSQVVLSTFQAWQKLSSFSTLALDTMQCADYCELYKCTNYIFCANNQNCLLYHIKSKENPSEWRKKSAPPDNEYISPIFNLGSYYGAGYICMAYEIKPEVYDRGQGWRLEDILTKLEQLNPAKMKEEDNNDPIDDPIEHSSDLVDISQRNQWDKSGRYVSRPIISATVTTFMEGHRMAPITLIPTHISHKWDNPSFAPYTRQSDNIDNTKFQIIFSDRRYRPIRRTTSSTNQDHQQESANSANDATTKNANDVIDGDIEDNGGMTVIKHAEYDDCARMCLNDLECSSFSYCHHDYECVITSYRDYSKIRSEEISQLDTQCSIVRRDYSDMFKKSEIKMSTRLPPADPSIRYRTYTVTTHQDCAALCMQTTTTTPTTGGTTNEQESNDIDFKCLSFDDCFTTNQPNCILYDKHFVGTSTTKGHIEDSGWMLNKNQLSVADASNQTTSINKAPTGRGSRSVADKSLTCVHHSRVFLVDFDKIHKKRLPRSMVALTINNDGLGRQDESLIGDITMDEELEEHNMGQPTVERCSRLCEEDLNCGAFEFCLAIKESNDEHFSSCSLGNNRTFELIGLNLDKDQNKHSIRKKQQVTINRLKHSEICSIYAYHSLSFILASRRKNTQYLVDELCEESGENKWWLHAKAIFRLDVGVLIVTLCIGIAIGHYRDDTKRLRELFESYQRSLSMVQPDDDLEAIIEDDEGDQQHQLQQTQIISSNQHDNESDNHQVDTASTQAIISGPSGIKLNSFSLEERRKASLTSLTDNIIKPSGELLANIDDNQL